MLQALFYCKSYFQSQAIIFYFLFCFSLQFTWNSFAEMDVEGSFRIRGMLSQIQVKKAPLSLLQGRLHVKGEFQTSNKFKAKVHFLSSNSYKHTFSFEKFIKIYPNVSWLINEDLELKLGRINYKNKFHQIVSINDYEPFFYAFDGAFLEYNTDILNINFWGAHLPKRWVGIEQIQDFKYGFGFFLDIESVSDHIDYFNIHVAYLGDSFFEDKSRKMFRYGLGLEGSINSINLAYTFVFIGHNPGVQFKLEEKMYHFQLSYSRLDFFNSKFFAGYHEDSSKYNPWLYDRHENAGFLDLFLWGNLRYYFVGFNASVDSLFDIKLSFYDYLGPKKEGNVKMGYFGSLLKAGHKGLIQTGGKVSGRELDIQLQKEIIKNFEIHLLAGIFIPRLKSKNIFNRKNFYNNVQLTGFYKF